MIMVQQVSVSELLGILAMALQSGLYFLLIATDIVFSDQYKNNTLKNEASYGLPRVRIYLGKLLSSVLVAVVLCAVLIGGYLAFSLLLFPAGEGLETSLRALGPVSYTHLDVYKRQVYPLYPANHPYGH